jgi:phosphoenolpyruvate-protein kinase (PTS system EI component)
VVVPTALYREYRHGGRRLPDDFDDRLAQAVRHLEIASSLVWGGVVTLAGAGHKPILVRTEIATNDIRGLEASAGILITPGGRTSHAAVVARQLNKVCIVGCRELVMAARRLRIRG